MKNLIKQNKIQKTDTYIVYMDCVYDNYSAYNLYIMLSDMVKDYPNVHIMSLLCFEYLLLSFDDFLNWLAPNINNTNVVKLLQLRNKFLQSVREQTGLKDNCLLQYLIQHYHLDLHKESDMKKLSSKSSEKVAAILLADICNKVENRDFVVKKTILGSCWTNSCVECRKKCNKLYLTSGQKAIDLYNKTAACDTKPFLI